MNNEKLFEQGDTGKAIYFISKGSVNVMQMREKIHTIKSNNECPEGYCRQKSTLLLSNIVREKTKEIYSKYKIGVMSKLLVAKRESSRSLRSV